MISKQKEIFDKFADERLEETTELEKKANLDNLTYRYKGSTANVKFNEFDNVLNLFDEIKEGRMTLARAKKRSNKI